MQTKKACLKKIKKKLSSIKLRDVIVVLFPRIFLDGHQTVRGRVMLDSTLLPITGGTYPPFHPENEIKPLQLRIPPSKYEAPFDPWFDIRI